MKYEWTFMINESGAALPWSHGNPGTVLFHCHAAVQRLSESVDPFSA